MSLINRLLKVFNSATETEKKVNKLHEAHRPVAPTLNTNALLETLKAPPLKVKKERVKGWYWIHDGDRTRRWSRDRGPIPKGWQRGNLATKRQMANLKEPLHKHEDVSPTFWKHYIQSNVKVDDNGCWIWQGSVNKPIPGHPGIGGYGLMYYRPSHQIRGTMRSVHRVAYELLVGEIPPGRDVMHICHVRNCCNPDHLLCGTKSMNMQDHYTRKKLSEAHSGRIHINNGIVNRTIKATTPYDTSLWKVGRLDKPQPEKSRKPMSGLNERGKVMWITNGLVMKRHYITDPIPEGFYRGTTFKSNKEPS